MVEAEATIKTRMTAAEFAQLPETTGPTELIDGELIVSPAPKDEHQKSLGNLYLVIRLLAMQHLPEAEVRLAPSDVYIDDLNAVQPDIFVVIGKDSKCRLGDARYWHGPPDLIVEVISTAYSSLQRDKVDKFRLYERYGVQEYWIVHPENRFVEVFVWTDGKYQLQGVYRADESFISAVLGGQTIDLKQVFTS